MKHEELSQDGPTLPENKTKKKVEEWVRRQVDLLINPAEHSCEAVKGNCFALVPATTAKDGI